MTTLLFLSTTTPAEPWVAALRDAMPELEVAVWPDVAAPAAVEYALAWDPPAGAFERLSSLALVFSLGAGVDRLLAHPELPGAVPVVRMEDPALTEGMSEYVLYHVLRFHRRMDAYERQRTERVWRPLPQRRPGERRVGIMGLGVLGRDAAAKIASLGFDTAGWSRTRKQIEGVRCFAGAAERSAFLRRTEILVCLLPLTRATAGILDRDTLAALPRGVFVVNAARGEHLVEADLLEALDDGHVAGAALDVFVEEPLPPGHPFWSDPRVALTPHVASLTDPRTAALRIAEAIRRHRAGRAIEHVVDRRLGY